MKLSVILFSSAFIFISVRLSAEVTINCRSAKRFTFGVLVLLLCADKNLFLAAYREFAPSDAVAKTRAVGDRNGLGGGERLPYFKGMKVCRITGLNIRCDFSVSKDSVISGCRV